MPPRQPQATKSDLRPGAIVTVGFPGIERVKRRPAVVLSTPIYHENRPDVILGLLTSRVESAMTPTAYALRDWRSAGLRQSSAFWAFVVTMPQSSVRVVGQLSDRDWQHNKDSFKQAVATG